MLLLHAGGMFHCHCSLGLRHAYTTPYAKVDLVRYMPSCLPLSLRHLPVRLVLCRQKQLGCMQAPATGGMQQGDLLYGPSLQELGAELVGHTIMVYRPKYSAWCDAIVRSYKVQSGRHW